MLTDREPIIGGRPDYHPIRFPDAMPSIDSGLPDAYERVARQGRASAFRHRLLRFAGGTALIAAVAGTTWGAGNLIGNMSDPDQSRRFEEFLKPDPLWRVPIGAGGEELLMTDQWGGNKVVEVRAVESRDLDKDVIGVTRPGCVVSVRRVYGPEYYVLRQTADDERLPLKIVDGNSYRTWLVGEFPLYELDGNGNWKPRLGNNGEQLFGKGYIAGVHATASDGQTPGCE